MLIKGGCHCGNLSFRLDWSPEPRKIPARACSCSFCQKHGGVWAACPTGSIAMHIRNPGLHSEYEFGTRTAKFHVCSKCGAVPVVTSEIEGNTYAVVSVRAMNDLDPALLDRSPVSFEGEDPTSRMARRKKGWTPEVRITKGGA
jgi:hypothetical protein